MLPQRPPLPPLTICAPWGVHAWVQFMLAFECPATPSAGPPAPAGVYEEEGETWGASETGGTDAAHAVV